VVAPEATPATARYPWGDGATREKEDIVDVLVAFATKHGSTGEVAAVVARGLAEAGFDVDLRPAGEVRELEGYDAVVLGAALYIGRVHPDARRLLARLRRELAERPLALFAMGPSTTTTADLEASRRQVDAALAKVPELEPLTIGVFGGVVDPARLRFPLNRMPATDARDWDAIGVWTAGLASLLAREVTVVGA
jgi:menaquinone-dependent protoporphyrinogen oxidase